MERQKGVVLMLIINTSVDPPEQYSQWDHLKGVIELTIRIVEGKHPDEQRALDKSL